jgi:hypothetical protein
MDQRGHDAAAIVKSSGVHCRYERTTRTLVNVTERKRWEYHPFEDADGDVNELARKISDETGLDWHGWWRGDVSALPDTALLAAFTKNDAGRSVLAGVMLLGDAITADLLRKVPVAALENSTNLGVPVGDSESAGDRVRSELAELPPLDRAAGLAPEDFSRLVAEHFKVWARYVPHPAAAMAAETGVKSPTVHTWIREARLRGFLPPARRGKG